MHEADVKPRGGSHSVRDAGIILGQIETVVLPISTNEANECVLKMSSTHGEKKNLVIRNYKIPMKTRRNRSVQGLVSVSTAAPSTLLSLEWTQIPTADAEAQPI